MNSKHRVCICVALIVSCVVALPTIDAKTRNPQDIWKPSQRVKDLVSSLSLEQKIGQMTQIAMAEFLKASNPKEVDERKLREYCNTYFIGSILDTPSSNLPILPLTPAEWSKLVNDTQAVFANEGSKIPIIFGVDSVHGGNYIYGSTLFPQNIGLGATFNRQLSAIAGSITAKDTRSSGLHWAFSPILDLSTNLIWSRVYETFGEDPYLVSEMGVANIQGLQGNPPNIGDLTKVAATAKHFIGYGAQKAGLDRTPSWIPERFLYEYFVPPFQAVIQRAQVATVMESYGEINGVPLASSKQYLKDLLRDELGFEGLLVTDWSEILNLFKWHKIASNEREATRISIQQTSIDMSMVPLSPSFAVELIKLVREGLIPESRIDESAARVLAIKEKLGLLDNATPPTNPGAVGTPEDRAAALEATRESIVLAKNEGLLPLQASALRRIAVIGPTSNSLTYQSGGWTFHWQGARSDSEFPYGVTILQGVQEIASGSGIQVLHSLGCGIDTEGCPSSLLTEAVEYAKQSEVVVLCLGEPNYTEKPGDITDLTLSEGQLSLARAVAATGTPIALVLVGGRPRLLKELPSVSKAVIQTFLPGPSGGQAVAEILFGFVNPSGRMPYSYPRTGSVIPISYWHKNSEKDAYQVEWEFGHGLSYSTFSYSDLRVTPSIVSPGQDFKISVTITNSGPMTGKHSVLVFITDEYRIITPEVKRLRAFEKISLSPGQSTTVDFALSTSVLEFIGLDNTPTLEAGRFFVSVGTLQSELWLQ